MSGASGHHRRKLRRRVVALLLSGMGCCAVFGADAPKMNDMPTQLVKRSDEVIAPLPTRDALPREISLDPLTPSEAAALKEDLYRESFDPVSKRGRFTCASWLFTTDGASLHLVGLQAGGATGMGMLKLNGRFRSAFLLNPVVVLNFREVSGFKEAIQMRIEAQPVSPWQLIMGSHRLKKQHDGACSFAPSAKCRRYEFEGLELAWNASERLPGSNKIDAVPIQSRMGENFGFVVEDMCPATRQGTIEGPVIGRLGDFGDRLSALRSGFFSNRSLREALERDLNK